MNEIFETFKEVTKLVQHEDNPETPYESQYKASTLLEKLLTSDVSPTDDNLLKDVFSMCEYVIGMIALNTDDNSKGEKYLMQFLEKIESKNGETRKGFKKQIIDCLNRLGILWTDRSDLSRAEEFLLKAERIGGSKEEEKDETRKFLWNSEFCVYQEGIEMTKTRTMFYLAQLFGLQKKKALSAEYAYKTLCKQLELKEQISFDRIEWARNCMGISEWHAEQHHYKAAEQCLLKAKEMIPVPEIGDDDPDETQQQLVADIDWTLARILLELFIIQASKLNSTEKGAAEMEEDVSPILFNGEPRPVLISKLFPIKNLENAKAAFREILALLQKASSFYVLDGFVTDHFKILLDFSRLWATISIYEPDLSRKCKMHKRRAKLFEPLLERLNPQHFGWQIQHIHYRLGEVYSDIAELKSELLRRSGRITSQVSQIKINKLIEKSEKHYELFLKSCEGQPAGENEEAIISSHFAIARLMGKKIGIPVPAIVKSLENSLEKYKWVVDYIAKRERDGVDMSKFQAESSMASEMIELLPQKIALVVKQSQ